MGKIFLVFILLNVSCAWGGSCKKTLKQAETDRYYTELYAKWRKEDSEREDVLRRERDREDPNHEAFWFRNPYEKER